MGSDFLGHQQLVMEQVEPRRWSWRVWLAPLACIAVACAVLGMMRAGDGDASVRGESTAGDQSPADAGLREADHVAIEELDDRSKRAMDALFANEVSVDCSLGSFLTVLEEERGEGDSNGVSVVAWDERGELPDAAESVLRAYQAAGNAALVTAGYLDLKGNAWGALVQLDDGAVDVMTVMTADDVVSKVRVARLDPEGDVG